MRTKSKLFQDRDTALVNDSPLEVTKVEHGFVEASQEYTFRPRPELDNQNLYCVYLQVNIKSYHHKKNERLKPSLRRMAMGESCTVQRPLLS